MRATYYHQEWKERTWFGRAILAVEPVGIALILVALAPAWVPLVLYETAQRHWPKTYGEN